MINALDAAQQKQAILPYAMTDLVLGPGQAGKVLPPEGIPAASLNADQQALVLDLVGEWVDVLNAAAAKVKMAEVEAHLAETYFAWSGPTTAGSAVYFRITGPTVQLEFAHQPGGGGQQNSVQAWGVNHIHTIYRDPTNDYGAGLSLGMDGTSRLKSAATTAHVTAPARTGRLDRCLCQVYSHGRHNCRQSC